MQFSQFCKPYRVFAQHNYKQVYRKGYRNRLVRSDILVPMRFLHPRALRFLDVQFRNDMDHFLDSI